MSLGSHKAIVVYLVVCIVIKVTSCLHDPLCMMGGAVSDKSEQKKENRASFGED